MIEDEEVREAMADFANEHWYAFKQAMLGRMDADKFRRLCVVLDIDQVDE